MARLKLYPRQAFTEKKEENMRENWKQAIPTQRGQNNHTCHMYQLYFENHCFHWTARESPNHQGD